MNILTSVLRTLLQSEDIADAATNDLVSYDADTWKEHVFISYDLNQFCYSVNIGRLPLVVIQENTANYNSEATNLEEVGGTVKVSWTIRVMTNAFANRRNDSYFYLQRLKQAILKKIAQTYSFEMVSSSMNAVAVSPISTYLDLVIESDYTYNDTFTEG